VVLTALLLLGLAGCRQVSDFFSDYRGVNLVAGAGFDSSEWSLTDNFVGATNVPNLDDYAAISGEVSGAAATTEGLPDGTDAASIRRLEILNLFPNGDFDDAGAAAESRWTVSAVDTSVGIATTGDATIDGNSLAFDVASIEDYITHPLAGSDGLSDGFQIGVEYSVNLDLRTDQDTLFGYNEGTVGGEQFTTWSLTTRATSPQVWDFFTEAVPLARYIADEAAAQNYFTIGSPVSVPEAARISQSGSLDNLRITRSDITPMYRLTVNPQDNPYSEMPIISGTYQFTVYVRTDPTHTNEASDESDNVANRFPAASVTLSMAVRRAEDSVATSSVRQTFTVEGTDGGWGSWTALTITDFLQTDDADYTDGELYVELTVSPTDLLTAAGVAPGALLIAAPTLNLTSQ
jgi:hypothetical protein